MTHMWGLHLVSGAMAVVGIGMLTFALLGISSLDQGMFYRLLAGSAAVMLADIATILYSLFAIHFYRFSAEAKQNAEQDGGGQPATRPESE